MGKLSHDQVVQLLLQISIMLVMGRIFAEIARRLKQPSVVGELIAGIIIGPTVLGMIQPDWFQFLFPVGNTSGVVLAGLVQLSVVMLLFIAGLEVDLRIVWQQGRQSILTSLLGLVVPFIFGFTLPYFFPDFFGIVDLKQHFIFSLFMGT
ncbi:MAG: cation/H(+) antiporter, partial [Cytophaga sp.]|nr:cation/H(+) antiporter [Cytophaga sp.]